MILETGKTALIVPCFIRSISDRNMLERLIDSALLQKNRFSIILIVDDKSPLIPNYRSNEIQYLRMKKNSGPAAARNAGLEKAMEHKCKYYLFTDHDCILKKDWSKNMVTFLQKSTLNAVGGKTIAFGKTLIDRFHDTNGTLNGRLILPDKKYLLYAPTCNFGITKKIAEGYKFDETYRKAAGEDVDFCLRISKENPIGYCSNAVLYHDFGYRNIIEGLSSLMNMFKKYKEANKLLYDSHPDYFKHSWFNSEPISVRYQ